MSDAGVVDMYFHSVSIISQKRLVGLTRDALVTSAISAYTPEPTRSLIYPIALVLMWPIKLTR
jgi:hypothetical protein